MTEFIIMMASMMSIVAISIDATLPALGVIGNELGASYANQPQLIISGIFFGLALGQLISGPLSDALGRKKILYIGFAIYLIGGIICYLSKDMTTILLGRFIQGLGVSGPYICAISIVRDKYSGRDMAKIMSLVMMIFMVVPAVAPALGTAIMYVSDWRGIFLFYILYSIILLCWMYFRLEETLPKERRIKFSPKNLKHGFLEIIENRTTVCYMICMGITFGGLIGYLNSCPQIFHELFNTGDMFAAYFAMLAVSIGAASFFNSRIVQKYGMRYICKRAMISIVTISCIFLALNFLIEIKLWIFMTYACVLFFCFGLMFGNLNSIAMEPMGHIAGTASAIIGATSSILSLSLGTFIGQLYNQTLIPMTMGFVCLGSLCLIFMRIAEGKKFASE